VGDIMLENVVGSVANVKGSLLLGQSFLSRFPSWSVDNATHSLMLGAGVETVAAAPRAGPGDGARGICL